MALLSSILGSNFQGQSGYSGYSGLGLSGYSGAEGEIVIIEYLSV